MSTTPAPGLLQRISSLDAALLATVAYADVFAAPVAAVEAWRYLIGWQAGRKEVAAGLACLVREGRLAAVDELYCLPGREAVIPAWRTRRARAAALAGAVGNYARLVASLPFVRMVALTGGLANNDAGGKTDVDLFIVTAPGRLWTVRALALGLARLRRPGMPALCPNYLLAQNALALPDRTLYTAQELARMRPLFGMAGYDEIRARNAWAEEWLPNAAGPPDDQSETLRNPLPGTRHWGEYLLGGGWGTRLEGWEMRRKVHRLEQQANGSGEVRFSAHCCQGHFDGHRARTHKSLMSRLEVQL